jgi:hypothetical protein
VQAKLAISQPGDVYEQEADRAAEIVMRMPDLNVEIGGETDEDTPLVLRKATAEHNVATPDFESQLATLRGSGQALPAQLRSTFEQRFSYDFSQVRLHIDAHAASLARAINARAFTIGSDIVFGTSEYTPTTPAGQKLLAHELTHVIQQQPGGSLARAARETSLGSRWTPVARPVLLEAGTGIIQSQRCAFGEIESWAIVSQRNHAAPDGLGDAVASIEAACARNVDVRGCHCVDAPGEDAPPGRRAAWRNISSAAGTDQSGDGNYFCVGRQNCMLVHQCSDVQTGRRRERRTRVSPSGTVAVSGKGTIYFYNIPNRGQCPPEERRPAPPRRSSAGGTV